MILRKCLIAALVCSLVATTHGGSAFASEPVLTLTPVENLPCDLDSFVAEYNRLYPETRIFIEDLESVAMTGSPRSPMDQIELNVRLRRYAVRVVGCMFGSFVNSKSLSGLEGVLKDLFRRYLDNRHERRAIWAIFQTIDMTYYSQGQIMSRMLVKDNLWVNLSEGAVYGLWAGSIVLTMLASRRAMAFRSRIQQTLGASRGQPEVQVVGGLGGGGKISEDLKKSLLTAVNIKQWGKNLGVAVGGIGASAGAIGGPLYIARKWGVLHVDTDEFIPKVDVIYNRMQMLELDCRIQALGQAISNKKYEGGSASPELKSDAHRLNQASNDVNFMLEFSQLHLAEVEWPAEMNWTDTSVTYKDMTVNCPGGFSRPEVPRITLYDVRKNLALAASGFVAEYGKAMLGPAQERLKKFFETEGPKINAAFDVYAIPQLKTFFAGANAKLERDLILGGDKDFESVEALVKSLGSYLGMRDRLTNRAPLVRNWLTFYSRILPEDTRKAMIELSTTLIRTLPPSLLNPLMFDLLKSQRQAYPANLLFLFHYGIQLEVLLASRGDAANKDDYFLPHEMIFSEYMQLKNMNFDEEYRP